MQFQPTEDQKAFQETARRFAREKLGRKLSETGRRTHDGPFAGRADGGARVRWLLLPAEFGGLGESSVAAGLVVEEIARADFNVSYIQLLGSLMGGMVARHASADIAKEWVPRVVSGAAVIGLTDRAARRL